MVAYQILNQLVNQLAFFPCLRTVLNSGEQLFFFFLMVRMHAVMKVFKRLRGNAFCQHGRA